MLVGKQIGPFQVEKELGSGAMGAVFRARYSKTGQTVAIKVMSPSLGSNATALARFEREGAILKQLKHPNIVRLYATGKFHGSPFYAMEFIEGESLDHVMARRGRMTWEEVVTLGRQLCAALQHAHEQGIIHRDLKPSNLMVLADGTVKLTDFGIAKDTDVTQLTSANCTVGTAAYMSPEQCRGERDLTLKSDLYSMGILFYELITGKKPFRADTPMDMFLQHVHATCERPSRLVLDVPVWLDTLICQLLEKKPEQRPLNAAMVAEALDRIVEKVEAQQSAGVDAVRARGGDHPSKRARLDEEDKEAARTLLGKRGKKKRKARQATYLRPVLIKGAVLGAVLVAVLALVYVLFLKKPTPEKLFAHAKKLMASKDRDDRVEAREGPIADFLKYYPKQDDAHAEQMRAWADQVDTEEQERRLLIWIRRKVEVTSDFEKAARTAVHQEDAGYLKEAKKTWESLLEHKDAEDPRVRSWGLLAAKRKQDLNVVFDADRRLKDHIDQVHKQQTIFEPDKGIPGEAATALLYEQFKDKWMARERWEKLRIKCREDSANRGWFLLAAMHLEKTKPPQVDDEDDARKKLIEDKLKEADGLAKKQRAQATFIYQDIIALYDKTAEDLAPLVAEARARLKPIQKR